MGGRRRLDGLPTGSPEAKAADEAKRAAKRAAWEAYCSPEAKAARVAAAAAKEKARWTRLGRVDWCEVCGQGFWQWSKKPRLECAICWSEASRLRKAARRKQRTTPEVLERQAEYKRTWWASRPPEYRQQVMTRLREGYHRRNEQRRQQPDYVAEVERKLWDQAARLAIREAMAEARRQQYFYDRHCAVCHEVFTPTMTRQCYCSRPCFQAANRVQQRERYRAWVRSQGREVGPYRSSRAGRVMA